MDSDQGKLFVGGISWETTEEKLKEYFNSFGEVVETVIMKERATGRARGFGFVIFADPAVADRVVLEKHTIDGRQVEAKRAVPKDEQQNVPRSSGGPALTGLTSGRTKKIFVGGLASSVTEEEFKKYFEQFGTITDVVVMYDHMTQRPRGFGFITFDTEDAVEAVLTKSFHELNDKMVEVKKAIPKEQGSQGGGSGASRSGRAGSFVSAYGGTHSYGGRGGVSYGRDGGYGSPIGGRGTYAIQAGGYGTGYGTSGGYGTGMNGGYTASAGGAYVGPASFASSGGYGASGYGSGGSGGYGTGSVGYGSSAVAFNGGDGSGGRSGTNSSAGYYGTHGPSSGYNTGSGSYGNQHAWGSSGGTTPGAGTVGGYGVGSYGYSSDVSYSGYASTGARGTGYGSGTGSTGYGGSGGGQTGGNVGAFDVYGNSGYTVDHWGSQTGAAGYSAAADVANGSSYAGGYGVAGRQTQRGPEARFQPYPARTGDRTG